MFKIENYIYSDCQKNVCDFPAELRQQADTICDCYDIRCDDVTKVKYYHVT